MDSSVGIAALITAIGGSIASIITALALWRNNTAKIELLVKDNERLRADNEAKTLHNEQQDRVILDQQTKINKWQQYGERIGRKMNEMELQIGYQHQAKPSIHDTQPIKMPTNKDWLTGPLGPIDTDAFRE